MYTRWLQVGAFSGTMRSHERGMSAGGCANDAVTTPPEWGPDSGTCSIIAPWNVGPKFFEANRRALQMRERLLPYIYTAHRQLFDTGVGIMQPLYYHYPALDEAYRMNRTDNAEYFFGNDILVAPITAPCVRSLLHCLLLCLPPSPCRVRPCSTLFYHVLLSVDTHHVVSTVLISLDPRTPAHWAHAVADTCSRPSHSLTRALTTRCTSLSLPLTLTDTCSYHTLHFSVFAPHTH
jgi:hypothetical protein